MAESFSTELRSESIEDLRSGVGVGDDASIRGTRI
jgi:hypothetical protein